MLARRHTGGGSDFTGQQVEDDAVLVGAPRLAVQFQEGRACRLLATEAHLAGDQAGDEPLEADRDLDQLPSEQLGDVVDHRA